MSTNTKANPAVAGAAQQVETQDAVPHSPIEAQSEFSDEDTKHGPSMNASADFEKSGMESQGQKTNTTHPAAGNVEAGTDAAQSPTDNVDEDAPLERHGSKTSQTSQADEYSKLRVSVVMFSLCMALFLAALDVTIITTALPTIAGVFHASSAAYTWIGSAYILAQAGSTPIWGKLSDIFGRKPVIIGANAIFLIGSLIAALSINIGMLIAARAIQGLGGGGLIVLVSICVSDLFSMRDRGKYYGLIGMTWALASGVGPIIGGAFTQKVSWRWCFYINLPLDGVSLLLLWFFLKLETPRTPIISGIKAIDWIGVVTSAGAVVMFLYGLESGGVTQPWDSAFVICLIVFGVVLFGLFIINEWKLAKYAIIPPRIFHNRSVVAALGVCVCHGLVFIGQSYYLPLYYQTVLGATPILSGTYLLALVLPTAFVSASTGIFIKKTGNYRIPIFVGCTFLALGTGLFISLDDYANWPKIIIYQILAGIGVGPLFQAPLIAIQSHLKGYDVAVGTATFGFVRNIATAMGVVLGGVIFQNQLAGYEPLLRQTLGPQLAGQFAESSFGSTTSELRHLPPAQKAVLDQAYTGSLRVMWIFFTAVAACSIVVACFIRQAVMSTKREKRVTGLEEQERVRLAELELKRQSRLERDQKRGGGSQQLDKDLEKAGYDSPVGDGDGASPTLAANKEMAV